MYISQIRGLMSLTEDEREFRRFYSVNNSCVRFDYRKFKCSLPISVVKDYFIRINGELKQLLSHQKEMLKNLLIVLDKRVYSDINFIGYNKDNFASTLNKKEIYYTLNISSMFNKQICNICIYKCKKTGDIKIFYVNLTSGRIQQIIRKLPEKREIDELRSNEYISHTAKKQKMI